ncbi:hypothetical protein COLU111180_09645 [Cohnella lubricantis]|uniref:Uncharacterized protein n=1 Tax=Cohnella lubricantis TaxID=2163172 RepID=A0A841THK1_9BACL|nr:hypothetical protein [Cohnella lubricantis]MBB6678427.1 hypothetical protein [Cohnella lubricantis]MBP2116807.1 hypothetical protein [Cohnella lubricantis]
MHFSPVMVNILGLKLNTLDHASVLNLGPSQHMDQFVSYKRNQGIGEQNGDLSPTILPATAVFDCDLVDSASVKASVL